MAAISFGEVPSNFRSEDFRMGKPHLVKPNDRALFEGLVLTQGSETSQYLEEKKTIVIPLVAASEKGEAQTLIHASELRGCKAGTLYLYKES